jgi:hypothetical protein
MSGGFDESIDNLRRYVAIAADALERIQSTTPTIESNGDALDDLEHQVDEKLSALDSEADGCVSDIDSGEGEALGEVSKLTNLAQEAADSRFPDAQHDLEEAGTRIDQTLDSAGSELQTDDQHLTSQGFEALTHALDEAEQGFDQTRTQNESHFQALDDALKGFEGDLESAYNDSGQKLEDARTDCGDEANNLGTEASTQVQAMEAAGTDFEGGLGTLETEAGSAYDGVNEQVGTESQELTDGLSQSLEDEARHLASELTDQIEQASTLVTNETAGPHLEELGTLREAVWKAESAGADLDPLVVDLQKCQQVLDVIQRLLDSLGG